MKLSIIIPAHNEEQTIGRILQKVATVNVAPWEKEVVVVNDGSSDATRAIAEYVIAKTDSRQKWTLVNHEKNMGKGTAIQSALTKVTGDYVIIQDADLEYEPEDIPKLLAALTGSSAVFGDRGSKSYPERGWQYVWGVKLLTGVFNVLYGAKLRDLYTGYKLVPAQALRSVHIQSAGFEFEAEVASKLARLGVTIQEVPIGYFPRGKSQGKHIRAIDGLWGLWTIIKLRFS